MSLTWFSQRPVELGLSALILALVCVSAACGSAADSGSAAAPNTGGAASNEAGAAGVNLEPIPQSLAFVPPDTLIVSPSESLQLVVQSMPVGRFRVRFALLGTDSDSAPGDAALDTNEVETDADGSARVTLTAPSAPTTFSVRASVGSSMQTLLDVTVRQRGYTALRVVPSYAGKRSVQTWTATATAKQGASCSKLSGVPPPDGSRSATAPVGMPLVIQGVPVGLDVVVTLRAGHYIGGCADQAPLREGDDNQVLVYASDRPVNLPDTNLELSFGPTDPENEFEPLMKASASSVESALLGAATDDVAALLDAMHVATASTDRENFYLARATHGWDAALSAAFGKNAARRLRDPARRWLLAGLSQFPTKDTFVGRLKAHGEAALLTLSSVAGLDPASAGFSSSFETSWSADSSDTLLLGTELSWTPSELVAALAIAPAVSEFRDASSVESALADSVDCGLVAQVLVANGTTPGFSAYATCDQACAEQACARALTNLWQGAQAVSGKDLATLSVTASGTAQVGDTAEVTRLDGTWVGTLDFDGDSAPTSGELTAREAAASR